MRAFDWFAAATASALLLLGSVSAVAETGPGPDIGTPGSGPKDTWGDDPDDAGSPSDAGTVCRAPVVSNVELRVEPTAIDCLELGSDLIGPYQNIPDMYADSECPSDVQANEPIFAGERELRPGRSARLDVPGVLNGPVERDPGRHVERYDLVYRGRTYRLVYRFDVLEDAERRRWRRQRCPGPVADDVGADADTDRIDEDPRLDAYDRDVRSPGLPSPYDTGRSSETVWNTGGADGCGCATRRSHPPLGALGLLGVAAVALAFARRW